MSGRAAPDERAGGSRYGPVDPSQWGWVAARNRCGRVHDEALERCLHRAYDDRVAELSLPMIDRVP